MVFDNVQAVTNPVGILFSRRREIEANIQREMSRILDDDGPLPVCQPAAGLGTKSAILPTLSSPPTFQSSPGDTFKTKSVMCHAVARRLGCGIDDETDLGFVDVGHGVATMIQLPSRAVKSGRDHTFDDDAGRRQPNSPDARSSEHGEAVAQ